MKTACIILAVGALLCGCNKPRQWEYKTVEINNTIHGYLERSHAEPSTPAWSDAYRTEQSDPGDFDQLQEALLKNGAEGWELVALVPQLESIPAEYLSGHDFHEKEPLLTPHFSPFVNTRTGKILLVFKRPLK